MIHKLIFYYKLTHKIFEVTLLFAYKTLPTCNFAKLCQICLEKFGDKRYPLSATRCYGNLFRSIYKYFYLIAK